MYSISANTAKMNAPLSLCLTFLIKQLHGVDDSWADSVILNLWEDGL